MGMGGRRVHRPEPKRSSGGAGCLVQFLVAAVCAVALGYFFGSYLFRQTTAVKSPQPPASQAQPASPAPTNPEAPAPPPQSGGKVELPELTIFEVQVGAFSQKANADRLVDAIKKQGWPAEQVAAGNLIQVRAGSFFGRQRAEALKERYTEDKVRPVVVTKVLAAKELDYAAADKEYYQFVQEVAGGLAETLLAAEEGRTAEAEAQVKSMVAAAAELPENTAGGKAELVGLLRRIEGELAQAARAKGAGREQAVSRAVAEFARWYAGLEK
ncbi:MAG: hypothetical protein PWQ41_676 [Bacillota bacterium]|nr:hypothetical protein [Bacillota bacterium]MDK2855678.1 hypothetical protein [Bacillota bacterium]MDK2924902.1 hypothetical protein [Bacillota bacterium]